MISAAFANALLKALLMGAEWETITRGNYRLVLFDGPPAADFSNAIELNDPIHLSFIADSDGRVVADGVGPAVVDYMSAHTITHWGCWAEIYDENESVIEVPCVGGALDEPVTIPAGDAVFFATTGPHGGLSVDLGPLLGQS